MSTDHVQPAYRPDTDPEEGGASTSSPLWTCPDCDGVGRIAERKDDIYCCPEHECEMCRGTGNVTDLRAEVWGEDAARDHKWCVYVQRDECRARTSTKTTRTLLERSITLQLRRFFLRLGEKHGST